MILSCINLDNSNSWNSGLYSYMIIIQGKITFLVKCNMIYHCSWYFPQKRYLFPKLSVVPYFSQNVCLYFYNAKIKEKPDKFIISNKNIYDVIFINTEKKMYDV